MKQLWAILLATVLAATPTLGNLPPPSYPVAQFNIFFPRDSAQLTDSAYSTLLDVLGAATRTYHGPIRVVGHIDQGERDAWAITRASFVREKLIRGGLEADRISEESAGASQPLGTAPENQRVTIHIQR